MHENNGECVCDECNGTGVIVIDTIRLYRTCKKCNGDKKFTWLEKVFGKNKKYHNHDMVNNIQLMIRKLQEYCYKEGYQITFEIKTTESPTYSKWYPDYL